MTVAKKKNAAEITPSEQFPRNAAETKQRIFYAAKRLFSKDIYSKIGTREIAVEAGVNLTLINRYFGSKKQLFKEVVMSLGGFSDSLGMAKEHSLAAIMDFLSEEENPRKEEVRLILFAAMDSDVSDIVSEFFLQQSESQNKLMHGDNKETKTVLSFSLLAGIALTALLFPAGDRKKLDKNYIIKYVSVLLDELYFNEEI